MTNALDIRELSFAWPGGAFDLRIPSFHIPKGQRVLLLGASGSGKSTLLGLICGITTPASGRIAIDGAELSALSSAARDAFRAERIGIIFQQFNLLPYMTALDNILLPLRFVKNRRERAGAEAALTLAGALGLGPDIVANGPAGRLSVGQQQRVAAARALIGSPSLIVADEPTSSLDAGTQAAFLDHLFAQIAAERASLLLVSHDARLAPRFDRVIEMADLTARDAE